MGQIVGGAAKPKRCNLNKLSQLGTPAAGEHILVSSDNSMNAAGQGNFDAYIVGVGNVAATALPLHYLADEEPVAGSTQGIMSAWAHKFVKPITDEMLEETRRVDDITSTAVTSAGFYYDASLNKVGANANYIATEVDVTGMGGGIISFLAYYPNDTAKMGFVLADGSLADVQPIGKTGYQKSLTIPINAVKLRFNWTTYFDATYTQKIEVDLTVLAAKKIVTENELSEVSYEVDEINKKIDGLHEDATDTAITSAGFYYNASLVKVGANSNYIATEVDVTGMDNATISFYAYYPNDLAYMGFVLADGTLSGVQVIGVNGGAFLRSLTIPRNAVKFRFNWTTYYDETYTQKIEIHLPSIAEDAVEAFEGGEIGKFNNVVANREKLALFLSLYKSKYYNDEDNRLVVSFNGDSIIGSQLDDITQVAGYSTGDFPPNLSKMIMARMFFDKYRFAGEDTQFRNLAHSGWTKVGFNTPNGFGDSTKTFNEIETYAASSLNDSAQISVNGYKFFKLVWSRYAYGTWACSVEVSVDGGSFTTPSEAGVDLPSTIGNENYSQHNEMQVYKVCKLDDTKTYVIRIKPTSNPANVTFWGCEFWNNPRLDVVVEAFSGSTAGGQAARMTDGYWSDWHKPQIIISDVLSINDFANISALTTYTMPDWQAANKKLYDIAQSHGAALLLFSTHMDTNAITKAAAKVAIQNGIALVDISAKKTYQPPTESLVNTSDGLHLSNYGNEYFFEELERIMDEEQLSE